MLPPCGHFWNSNGKSCADGTSFSSGLRGSKEETLATSWEELTHWKRLWCWEGLGAKGEGDDRGWDGWMASLTRWTWAWVNSGNWWWTGRPGVLRFLGSQRVGHDWASELNWTELKEETPAWRNVLGASGEKESNQGKRSRGQSPNCFTHTVLKNVTWKAFNFVKCYRNVNQNCKSKM